MHKEDKVEIKYLVLNKIEELSLAEVKFLNSIVSVPKALSEANQERLLAIVEAHIGDEEVIDDPTVSWTDIQELLEEQLEEFEDQTDAVPDTYDMFNRTN